MWKILLNEIFRARGSSLPTPVLKWELLLLLVFLLGDLGIQEMELSLVEARGAAKTNRSRNPFRRGESTEEITQLPAEEKTPERSEVHDPSPHLKAEVLLSQVSCSASNTAHICCGDRGLCFLTRAIP